MIEDGDVDLNVVFCFGVGFLLDFGFDVDVVLFVVNWEEIYLERFGFVYVCYDKDWVFCFECFCDFGWNV